MKKKEKKNKKKNKEHKESKEKLKKPKKDISELIDELAYMNDDENILKSKRFLEEMYVVDED